MVATRNLEATLRSSLQGLRCRLARGLLDLGLGGVDLNAQWAGGPVTVKSSIMATADTASPATQAS